MWTSVDRENMEWDGTLSAKRLRGDGTAITGISVSKLSAPDGNPDPALQVDNSGNIGIAGAISNPRGILHVSEADFADLPLFERSGGTINGLYTAARIAATKTTDMGDNFGTVLGFSIQDDAGVLNQIGYIGASRNGADNSGNIKIGTYSAGTDTVQLEVKNDGTLQATGRIKDATGYVTPVGAIQMYGGSTAPDGWLLCNNAAISRTTYAALFAVISTTFGSGDGSTTFNVPDMRGIFPRGAGTSAKLTDANAAAFVGVLGTYQNDQAQGHYHYIQDTGGNNIYYNTIGALGSARNDVTLAGTAITAKGMFSNGTNGVPRVGTETNPANLGLNFIIKY